MVMWSQTLANLWRRAHAHKCVYDCYSSPVQIDFSWGLDPVSSPARSPIIRHHVGGCSLTRGLADGLSVLPGPEPGGRVTVPCSRPLSAAFLHTRGGVPVGKDLPTLLNHSLPTPLQHPFCRNTHSTCSTWNTLIHTHWLLYRWMFWF